MNPTGLDIEKYGLLTDDVIAVMKEKQIPLETVSLVLEILSVAEKNKRENIRKRQAEGIKAARARGIHLGRPAQNLPENFGELVKQWERGRLDFPKVLELSGLNERTFYRRLKEYRRAINRSSRRVYLVQNPPENFGELVEQWELGRLDFPKVLELSGLKERTFYRCLKKYKCMTKGK